jgi:small subunit ribosomal protein S6
MNIECNQETLNELTTGFRFNDAIIRNLVMRLNGPVTTPSQLVKSETAKSETSKSDEITEEVSE